MSVLCVVLHVWQVASLKQALQAAQSTLLLAGQPHQFLLQELSEAKAAAQQADGKALAALAALRVSRRPRRAACTAMRVRALLVRRGGA